MCDRIQEGSRVLKSAMAGKKGENHVTVPTTDLLLTGGMIVTMNNDRQIHCPGSVVVDRGHILDLGPTGSVDGQYKPRRTVDIAGRIVIPGLVNAHTHVAMAFSRGLGRLSAMDPLYDVAWPLESLLEAADIYPLAALGMVESLKTGTTTVCDHYFFMEEVARACLDVGVRGVLGPTLMDLGGPLPTHSTWAETLEFFSRWQGRNPRIIPALAPHATDTLSSELMAKAARLSREEGFLFHLHVSQSSTETRAILERHGKTPVGYLEEVGGLGPQTLAVHCIHLHEGDLEALLGSGCSVAYCPSSHASTGQISPAAAMMRSGVPVALGTDCALFNDDMDMFEEVRAAILTQNTLEGISRAVTATQALEMATIGGARALGMEESIGSLEKGKMADLVILNADSPRMTPLYPATAVAVVALCAGEAQVESVFVNGIELIDKGCVTTVDEADIVKRGREASGQLVQRARKRAPALYKALFQHSRD